MLQVLRVVYTTIAVVVAVVVTARLLSCSEMVFAGLLSRRSLSQHLPHDHLAEGDALLFDAVPLSDADDPALSDVRAPHDGVSEASVGTSRAVRAASWGVV